MRFCSCGEIAEDASDRCARCTALETLDLRPTATRKEINSAYYTFAKVWHPDRFQHDEKLKRAAEEKLKTINAAYALLTSPPIKSQPRPEEQPTATDKTPKAPEPIRSYPNRWQRFSWSLPRPTTLVAIAAVVAGLCVAVFLVTTIDSYLTGEPIVGEQYSNFKDFFGTKLRDATRSAWNSTADELRSLIPGKNSSALAATAKPDAAQKNGRSVSISNLQHRHEINAAQPVHVKLAPYITAGLTRAEVIAIQGVPSSASEDRLAYGKTEFYFSGDKLAGWRIDPTSVPARVKLWPETEVSPSLQSFTLGSTKDQVIAVQGTPTLFADDRFGYGESEVYFQNDRVTGWKADPTSEPLHASAR